MSQASHLTRQGVQHAVHELRALRAAVALGQADGFLQHDARRSLAYRELSGREAQHRALDCPEPFHAPVLGHLRETAVELSATAGDDVNQYGRNTTLFR